MNDTETPVTPTAAEVVVVSTKGHRKRPIGLEWRASYWFTTIVIGSGIAIDLLVYSIIIPVIPFQLEHLGYENVSALAGWLLFAYSGGLLLSTFPIAALSERYNARRWPLIIGFVVLIGSQFMFMEAPNYAVMCVARVIQGIGSSIVWVIGLALLCDCTPEQLTGRESCLVLGPPVGGALYSRFGFRGPFIFGAIFAFVDLLGRFVVIERKDSLKWGYDPFVPNPLVLPNETDDSNEKVGSETDGPKSGGAAESTPGGACSSNYEALVIFRSYGAIGKISSSISRCIYKDGAFDPTPVHRILYSSQEPSLPIHLQTVWGLSSEKVGIIFIAAVVPTLFSSPLTGWISDKRGTEWVTMLSLILGGRLGLFIAAFGLSSKLGQGASELAAVSRSIEGVGFFSVVSHSTRTLNIAYLLKLYAHLEEGWQAIVILAAALCGLGVLVATCFTGDRPLIGRLKVFLGRNRAPQSPEQNIA
ncbi:major facilitator superfamily domain-containing protein [Ephemerocybe angulata]|uniref:Major facilitator superfamily domain-containing protein n=1 Tax=Ephemerocybe angulata TaxID=980116 RepID=A0A8H6IKW6_9AGAR|nr:major facilitator superfamily domain-containing protein [Tulosesus angulatus]